jgi:hypothetical protein
MLLRILVFHHDDVFDMCAVDCSTVVVADGVVDHRRLLDEDEVKVNLGGGLKDEGVDW